MNFLEFYPSIFILHFVAFGFFLPEEINPLPVGMKTGYVVHALISLHALSSTVTAMASVDGFLTFFFTVFMEIIVWLSIIVFGVTAKSLRLFGGLGAWLQDDDTQTALLSLGEALEGVNETVDYTTNDVVEYDEPNQTTEPTQNDLSTDEDISRFKRMSDGTRNKVNQMWERAFRRK
jgi:hypothetical protein